MKDRVMSDEQLEAVEEAYLAEDFSVNTIRLNRGHTEDLRRRVAEAQDKISFKAGVNEVVEWLRKDCPDEYGSWKEWSVFQSKLEEWGISDGK